MKTKQFDYKSLAKQDEKWREKEIKKGKTAFSEKGRKYRYFYEI